MVEVEMIAYREATPTRYCIHDNAVKGDRYPEMYARKWQKRTIAEENQNIFPKTMKADLVGLAGRATGPLKT